MIRIVVPALLPITVDKDSKRRCGIIFRRSIAMLEAEAWQSAAAANDFAFDPSAESALPRSFSSTASRLARALYGFWEVTSQPVPRTITSVGATVTAWPARAGVPLFDVDMSERRCLVYMSGDPFVTASFGRFKRKYGYTIGALGARTAHAVAAVLGDDVLEPAPGLTLWPASPAGMTSYSVIARTLLAMARTVLHAGAPELRARMDAIDFDEMIEDSVMHLTVIEVHAL